MRRMLVHFAVNGASQSSSDDLSPQTLKQIQQLETQLEKLKKEREQKQFQIDGFTQVRNKCRRKQP